MTQNINNIIGSNSNYERPAKRRKTGVEKNNSIPVLVANTLQSTPVRSKTNSLKRTREDENYAAPKWMKTREFNRTILAQLNKANSFLDKIEKIKKEFSQYSNKHFGLYLTLEEPKGVHIKMVLDTSNPDPDFTIYESIEDNNAYTDCEIIKFQLNRLNSKPELITRNTGKFLTEENTDHIVKLINEMFDRNKRSSAAPQDTKIEKIIPPILSQSFTNVEIDNPLKSPLSSGLLTPSTFITDELLSETSNSTSDRKKGPNLHIAENKGISSLTIPSTDEEEAELPETKWVDKKEFNRDFLKKIENKKSFQEKFSIINNYFSKYSNTNYGLYLTLQEPKATLKLALKSHPEGWVFHVYENIKVEKNEEETIDNSLFSFIISPTDSKISNVKIKRSKNLPIEQVLTLYITFAKMLSPAPAPHCIDEGLLEGRIKKQEFMNFWESLKKINKYAKQVEAIQKFFKTTNYHKHSLYVQWDELKDISLKFVLSKGKFKSEALTEEFFREGGDKSLTGPPYYSLRVFEKAEANGLQYEKKILDLHISETAKKGELSWIERGDKLDGNEVLTKIYEMIPESLLIQTVWLYDDAKKYNKKTKSALTMRIREILTSPDETSPSWYEKRGCFKPSACSNVKTIWEEYIISQDPQKYVEAKKLVRNTTLDQLAVFLKPFPEAHKNIKSIRNKYLPNRSENDTIHHLAKAINERIRSKETSQNEKEEAENDLDSLISNSVSPPWKTNNPSEALAKFQEALDTIENTRLFERTYR